MILYYYYFSILELDIVDDQIQHVRSFDLLPAILRTLQRCKDRGRCGVTRPTVAYLLASQAHRPLWQDSHKTPTALADLWPDTPWPSGTYPECGPRRLVGNSLVSGTSKLVDIAVSKGLGGHRESYLSICSELLDLEPFVRQRSFASALSLLSANKVLFVTLDDHWVVFITVACVRSILRKKTVGLLLRGPALIRSVRLIDRLKCAALKIVQRSKKVHVVSIVPHNLLPALSSITKLWVHDPQMWDLRRAITPNHSKLSQSIQVLAKKRKLMIFIGQVVRFKGIEVLCKLCVENLLGEDILVVIAGRVSDDCRDVCRRIEVSGGIVVDRYLTDSEIESLYGIASYVWCAYSADYDQASGVFGRAIQLGVPAIVRKGSLVEKYAGMLDLPILLSVEFDSIELLQDKLRECRSNEARFHSSSFRYIALDNWKQDFVTKMRDCL